LSTLPRCAVSGSLVGMPSAALLRALLVFLLLLHWPLAAAGQVAVAGVDSVPLKVNIAIIQPTDYVHALGFVDQARYLRYQLSRLGAEVTLSKQRLRADAINVVMGAHTSFHIESAQRAACVFWNLEQLGSGGADVPGWYLQLLRDYPVIEYNIDNVHSYRPDSPASVPVLPFLHAPYLYQPARDVPLEQRQFDILFIGAMNSARRELILRLHEAGITVHTFTAPLYGEERDVYIRNSKAVLNIHFYASSRFEQVRVSHCLSLGTPVISQRAERTRPHPAFEDVVFWFDAQRVVEWFQLIFGTPEFFDASRQMLQRWRQTDAPSEYAELHSYLRTALLPAAVALASRVWSPSSVSFGASRGYNRGWLNLDVTDQSEPDLVLDLTAQPLALPYQLRTRFGALVRLEAHGIEHLQGRFTTQQGAESVRQLLHNAIRLLKPGGTFSLSVQLFFAGTESGWRLALREYWAYAVEGRLFELVQFTFTDVDGKPVSSLEEASLQTLLMRVRETSLEEKMLFKTNSAMVFAPADAVSICLLVFVC
jgi:hypothetical protein